jgi:hypothetical protein
MLKKFKKVTVRFNYKPERYEESEVHAEIKDNTLHIIDALGDEMIFPLNSVQSIFFKTYKEIPKEIGE